jgi:hypothetical protein
MMSMRLSSDGHKLVCRRFSDFFQICFFAEALLSQAAGLRIIGSLIKQFK